MKGEGRGIEERKAKGERREAKSELSASMMGKGRISGGVERRGAQHTIRTKLSTGPAVFAGLAFAAVGLQTPAVATTVTCGTKSGKGPS